MIGHEFGTFEALLDSLSDGVLVIDFDGSVRIANPAFCRMFGIVDDDWAGREFGTFFMLSEGFDDFTNAVLDAITKRGEVERRIVQIQSNEDIRFLSVTASTLTEAGERKAVIVTVSDITEIRELQEMEQRQAGVIKEQLGQLQDAYRNLEARNEALSVLTRRIRTARGIAVTFVVTLFLGIGVWQMSPLDFLNAALSPDRAAAEGGSEDMVTFVVVPQDFSSTIDLRGNLSPGRVVEVVSPIESHVREVHVAPGDLVSEGDLLVDLDTGRLATELRQAEVESIRVHEHLAELEDWNNSSDMARSRRSLRRARVALDDAELQLDRTSFLLESGLVPASQHEEALRSLDDRQLDVEEAERELAAVRSKGTGDALRVARLQAQSAADRLRIARESVNLARVLAPIDGIIIAAQGRSSVPLAKGRQASQGGLLLSVADMERFSVVTSVDEIDLRKVKVGQKVWVTGPGFDELKIPGQVVRVSLRALAGSRRGGAPKFEIAVLLDRLEGEALNRLRVGMSAHVSIVVHDRPNALLVPIDAVWTMDGKSWLEVVIEPGGNPELREVQTGLTTLDSVEVVKGLSPGDTVVLSR